MGGKSSKSKGQVLHTQEVPSGPPYPGPSARYHFVTCQVCLKHQINFGFMSAPILSSNVDAYYGLLAEQYAKGMRMLTFYRIPQQSQRTGGFFNPEILVPFQGIFCSYPDNAEESSGQYQLRVEKSAIEPELLRTSFMSYGSQVVTNTQHLYETLGRYADMGGRLICIEITGEEQVTQMGFRARLPILGCDLFFEMPCGEVTQRYIYNVVCVPIAVDIIPGFTPKTKIYCDWMGTLASNLNQGWKLVEIFYDKTCLSRTGFTSQSQLNCQWYFEKPASHASDPTPRYEGTIVEHQITSSFGQTKTNWEPIIQNMGNKGWELACIHETPEVSFSIGLTNKIHVKTLLFFQRKIIPGSDGSAYEPVVSKLPPPPAYPGEPSKNSMEAGYSQENL